jgi:hypothetical protein
MSNLPTFVWSKEGESDVVADERQFDDLTSLGYAPKLNGKKPVLGPTQSEIAQELAAR